MKAWFGLVVVGRRSLMDLADGSSFGSLVVRLMVSSFRLLVLEVCFLNGFIPFNPFLATMALRGNTPSGQSKIFLPPLPPTLPILFSPPAFLKPLKFQIGLHNSSEHLTNFDIRSSGDFSAGKPHVSVRAEPLKVNNRMPRFNNRGWP